MQGTTPRCSYPSRSGNRPARGGLFSPWRAATISLHVSRRCWIDDQSRGRVGRRRATGLIVAGAIAILGVAPITVARAMPQTQATGTAAPVADIDAASIKRNPSERDQACRRADDRHQREPARHLLIFAFGVRRRSITRPGGSNRSL